MKTLRGIDCKCDRLSVYFIFSPSGWNRAAVVSGITLETRSVTVERFETKGKEIKLEAILNLS